MVSVIIPCRNERKYIGACLDSVVANSYPKEKLEVLVVDGMSEDGTLAILHDYTQRYPYIRVLENPNRRIPNALNIAIAHAKGDVIVRLDAHARYDVQYVAKCVEHLEECSADNVGGVRKTEPQEDTVLGKAIAYSLSIPFTAGNARFRVGTKRPRCVDTVFGGCFRRDIFRRVGVFNEGLTRAEDREFNQRLRDSGGKILLTPDIQCTYYARSRLLDFIRWTIAGSAWVFFGSKIARRRIFAFRNFVPLAFLASLLLSFTIAWFVPAVWWIFGGIVSVYGLASVASAMPLVKKERDLRYLVAAPFVFALTHILYAVGSIYGILTPAPNVRPRLE
jgi:glycosyltransferase involved in cell wall biosynthesis